jgi:hypothetical protein
MRVINAQFSDLAVHLSLYLFRLRNMNEFKWNN